MTFKEMTAIHCERRYTKVINALCGGTGKVLLMLKRVVHIVTTALDMLNNVIKNEQKPQTEVFLATRLFLHALELTVKYGT